MENGLLRAWLRGEKNLFNFFLMQSSANMDKMAFAIGYFYTWIHSKGERKHIVRLVTIKFLPIGIQYGNSGFYSLENMRVDTLLLLLQTPFCCHLMNHFINLITIQYSILLFFCCLIKMKIHIRMENQITVDLLVFAFIPTFIHNTLHSHTRFYESRHAVFSLSLSLMLHCFFFAFQISYLCIDSIVEIHFLWFTDKLDKSLIEMNINIISNIVPTEYEKKTRIDLFWPKETVCPMSLMCLCLMYSHACVCARARAPLLHISEIETSLYQIYLSSVFSLEQSIKDTTFCGKREQILRFNASNINGYIDKQNAIRFY